MITYFRECCTLALFDRKAYKHFRKALKQKPLPIYTVVETIDLDLTDTYYIVDDKFTVTVLGRESRYTLCKGKELILDDLFYPCLIDKLMEK